MTVATLTRDEALARAKLLPVDAKARLRWNLQRRASQTPPAGDWLIWLILAGRGFGKTRTGAEWIAEQAWRHPGTRWAIVAPTYADARDTCIEGDSGLLHALGGEVNTWNRSLGELELTNGSKVKLFSADEPERLRGPQHHGAWCVAAEVPVLTARGDVPIADVVVGDRVWTRQGWRRVTAASLTKRQAPVVTVSASDGSEVRCTADHPVLSNGAWCDAGMLEHGATLDSWSSSTARPHTETGKASAGTTTTRRTATAATSASRSPKQSGSTLTAPSPLATMSTTSTRTLPTTTPPTLKPSSGLSTEPSTPPRTARSHMGPQRAPKRCGQSASLMNAPVNTAPPATSPGPRTARTVDPTAEPQPVVVDSVKPSGWADVYDLTIEGAHEFYAGGILVHNCDELAAWRYPDTWDQLQFGLRLVAPNLTPRTVVTTTPKPTALVRQLVDRATTHVTTGSTFENAANLAPAALDELRNLYEGTRIGRQELYAELLLDTPGALWSLAQFDTPGFRAAEADVPDLVRVVTAVDPAVTSGEESDSTGIVTVGIDHAGDLWVLADDTCRLSPEGWASTAVGALDTWGGDRIVAEVNNGGDLVESVLRAVDRSVPYRKVHASRGKRVRAEPVAALYEQGRVHHVGVLSELEEQMCSWAPDGLGGSPDRVDALVWAVTDLAVRKSGRRRGVVATGVAA